jgi:hypothetical protein
MNRVLPFALCALISSTAIADDLMPKYDVDGECRKSNYNEEIVVNQCIEDEQNGYDYLKSVWAEMTPDEKAECVEQYVSKAHGAYRYHRAYLCAHAMVSVRQEQERLRAPHHFHE